MLSEGRSPSLFCFLCVPCTYSRAWHVFPAIPRLCTYLAALYLQVSSFLSWGAFSNVLEGCSGWKCSELNPLGTASSCGTQLPCPSNKISEARVLHHFPEFLCGINLHAPTVAADLTATLNWLPYPAPVFPTPHHCLPHLPNELLLSSSCLTVSFWLNTNNTMITSVFEKCCMNNCMYQAKITRKPK